MLLVAEVDLGYGNVRQLQIVKSIATIGRKNTLVF
jgi:hypothetical protein